MMTNLAIDIALTTLCEIAKPQQTLSRIDIADVCDCTAQNIYLIERQALKKLKKAAARIGLHDYLEVH